MDLAIGITICIVIVLFVACAWQTGDLWDKNPGHDEGNAETRYKE